MRHLVRAIAAVVLFLFASMQAAAEQGGPVLFALEGAFVQETVYTYTITATPESVPSDVTVTMSVPISRTWQYRRTQDISDLNQTWNPYPDTISEETDGSGNVWSTATWSEASEDVEFITQVRCREETTFGPILTWFNDYPLDANYFPEDVLRWLEEDSWQVQSDAPEIRQLAQEISSGAILQIEVVGRILAWVQENVRVAHCYEPVPQIDALWTLQNRMGICVNFANLAVALLRTAGIPAVGVTGLVADVEDPGVLHAWIAVYFMDLGWFEFESSSWMPGYEEVPVTILTPQHITLHSGEERGISSSPSFVDHHTCSLDVLEKPRELQFVDTKIEPGDAVTWVITLRSQSFYEIYECDYGYRDLQVSLSLDGTPPGWYVSLSATDFLLRKQDVGAAPSRSLLMTIVPPEDVAIGTQGVITLTARDMGESGQPVVGVITVAVTIKAP